VVCGAFKSGTSLATMYLEQAGWHNPASVTNPAEHGFGSDLSRYRTRECTGLRRLNDGIMLRERAFADLHTMTSIQQYWHAVRCGPVFAAILDYLAARGGPTVLKDPRLVFTLPLWITAGSLLGRETWVVFTRRNKAEVAHAWDQAPYTRKMLQDGVLSAMLRFQKIQGQYCIERGVPHATWSFRDLIAMVPSSPEHVAGRVSEAQARRW
jgi:hypothetical protein